MPLEIRELIIRTQIVTEKPHLQQEQVRDHFLERKALIEECVEKVLHQLQRNQAR